MILGFSQAMQARGWGSAVFEEMNYEKGRGKVTSSDSPFKGNGNGVNPSFQWIRGILTGFLGTVFKRKVNIVGKEGGEGAQVFIFE